MAPTSSASSASDDYHLRELAIAASPGDPRRVMPAITGAERRVLDVGCGAGQTLIAAGLPPGATAVGADVDADALSLGRRLTEEVRFVRAAGEALPFRAECFDLVLSRVALPYMHVPRALGEMWRVLRPGGRVWLVLHPPGMTLRELWGNVRHLELKGAAYRIYVLANGLALHALGRQLRWPFGGGRSESFQTRRAITRALRGAGFDGVEVRRAAAMVATATKPKGGRG